MVNLEKHCDRLAAHLKGVAVWPEYKDRLLAYQEKSKGTLSEDPRLFVLEGAVSIPKADKNRITMTEGDGDEELSFGDFIKLSKNVPEDEDECDDDDSPEAGTRLCFKPLNFDDDESDDEPRICFKPLSFSVDSDSDPDSDSEEDGDVSPRRKQTS